MSAGQSAGALRLEVLHAPEWRRASIAHNLAENNRRGGTDHRLRACLLAALGLVCTGIAHAQVYPSRPITVVVPYPAGGPTDTLARILAERMKTSLGQALVIENVSGAGGSIGVGRVAQAAPDGYTVSIGHVQTHVLNAATMHLSYDVVNGFAPVSLIADTPIWIISRKDLPADDLKGFIAWLKANDGKANHGTVGVGGPTDIAGLLFQKATGTKFQTVPYRGGAPLLTDLLAGHVDFAFGQAATYLAHVRAGQLKAYGCSRPSAGGRRPRCRPSTSSACRTSTPPSGTASGCPSARRRR